jgi:hypothetical protein
VDYNGESETFHPVYVNLSLAKGIIKVYPNPNPGNVLNLKLNNFQSGHYQVQLVNSKGRIILQKSIRFLKESSQFSTELLNGQQLSKGVYFLRFLNENEKTLKKIIVQ